jgi:hypothetical protein
MERAHRPLPLQSPSPSRPGASTLRRAAYPAIILVMSGIVLYGFWPYYAGLLTGGTRTHWILHVHAAVFTAWLVLLLAQSLLVARRRVRTHRRLGRLGIAYAGVLLLVGLAVALVGPALLVVNGQATLDEAAGFLLLPPGDLVTRRRSEPVYLVGLGLCLLAFSRVFLMEWEGWVRVGRAILVGLFPQVGGGGG